MDPISKLLRRLFTLPKPPAYDLGARIGMRISHRDMMQEIETTDPNEAEVSEDNG